MINGNKVTRSAAYRRVHLSCWEHLVMACLPGRRGRKTTHDLIPLVFGRMMQSGARPAWTRPPEGAGPPASLTSRTPPRTSSSPPCWSAPRPRTWTAAIPKPVSRGATATCSGCTRPQMRFASKHLLLNCTASCVMRYRSAFTEVNELA